MSDHPTETHRRRQLTERAELATTLDRLNDELAGLTVDMDDAQELTIGQLQAVVDGTRRAVEQLRAVHIRPAPNPQQRPSRNPQRREQASIGMSLRQAGKLSNRELEVIVEQARHRLWNLEGQ